MDVPWGRGTRGTRGRTRPTRPGQDLDAPDRVGDVVRGLHSEGAAVIPTALWLLAIQGVIGAFDTLYYHEWRARLPARGAQAAAELNLHALRDFLYAVIFGTLPWLAWQGVWVLVLLVVLAAEVILTMADFVVEITVRKPLGDVYAGERITHAVMGIVYGAMLASLIPIMIEWGSMPTALALT